MMIGKTVAHYIIIEQLGEGGMGVVYKAEDKKLHRTVALKFLPPAIVVTEADKERLAAEARAAASLDHPNICTVYEINEYEGQDYIAMAYVEGRSLREEIDDAPLVIDRAIDIAVQVARGLSAAHERGIVHRDIKSANIMVTPKGDARIMDFGIAQRAGAGAVPPEDATTAGTLAYSSPEQLQNDDVDRRSDIWSLGVTLYEMIAGEPPFRGDYPSAMAYSIQSEPPEALSALRPDVPEALERVVNRALAKNPADRYQSADEMLEDLRALQIERDPTISKVLSGVAGARHEPWYKHLLTGRALAAAAVYLLAVYAAVQLTGWLVSRYVWSPHLTGIVALALLSLLPSAVLLVTSAPRGAGRQALTIRNIGVPINVAVSIALALAFFAGKDLGAATTTVSVTDEDGNTVRRVVPKGEFRKKTAVFFFENETGDSTLAWIHQAIPVMLQLDLYQDPFVVFRSGMEPAAVTRLKRAGFNNWEKVPVALLQKIAGELYTDYFLTGSYSYDAGEYAVRMALHDTGTGNLVSEHIVRNQNLFAMIDAMTVWLKRELGLPEGHIEQVKDLPVSDIVTDSETALRMYVSGQAGYLLENDGAAMIRGAEGAVAEDSTFALAYLTLYVMYRMNNRAEEAGGAIDKVMTYLYKLPERQQYVAKALYYDYKQDPDRYLAVLEMLVELYPDDLQSRGILASVYTNRRETDKAIEQYQLALKFDPYNFEFLSGMVDLYVDQAKFDDALEVLEAYAEAQPEDIAALIKSGEVNETRGDLDAAGRAYDRALIIDPANVEVLLKLSTVETKTGDFGAAVRHFDDALKLAKSPEDRYSVYDGLADYYEICGQPRRVLEATEKMLDQAEQWLPPLQAQFVRLVTLDRYVEAGQTERAFTLRDSLGGLIAPPLDKLAAIGDVGINLALDRPSEAAASLIVLEEAVNALQIRVLERRIWQAKGDIAVLDGDHETAVANFEEQLALEPSKTSILRKIGSCQRELGRYEKARESIQRRLVTHPMDPKAHYELALVYADTGNMSKALEHLRRALEVWREADPDYEPAIKARDKLKEWQSATSM